MKKVIRFSLIVIMIVDIIVNSRTFASETGETSEPSKINAYTAVLMDKRTGRVLWEKNANDQRAMASTTKIMTCIIALEYCELDEIVSVSANASKAPKVKLYIKPEEEYVLEDLLYALMLVSSNDVAIAIAEHVAGSVENFCDIMTKKAKEIGAINTSFKTPNGLDAEGHYSTAYDLALITRYALNNEKFTEIINTPSHSFLELTTNKNFSVNNRNSFLNMYNGANGVKTGYTSEAGYCFVGTAKREDLELIGVVLASGWPPNKTLRWNDITKIMDYGFGNFETNIILEDNNYVCQIKVKDGIGDTIDVITSEDVTLTYSESEKIDILYNVVPELFAPIHIGQEVGNAEIFIDSQYYSSIPLISNTKIEKIDFDYCLDKVLNKFLLFTEE